MKRAACALLALLGHAAAHANGFIDASLGAAWRDPDTQLDVDYDTGTVARLEVGTQYESGLQLRVGYTYTFYDALTALGSLDIAEDIQQQETRVGIFHATPRGDPRGWRLGGGYVYVDEENELEGGYQRGGFVEVAAVIKAGKRVTLDLAAAAMKLGGTDDYDAEAAELRAVAAFHTRVMDFTVGARYAAFDRESPFDEQLFELRVGIGGAWRYPEGASY